VKVGVELGHFSPFDVANGHILKKADDAQFISQQTGFDGGQAIFAVPGVQRFGLGGTQPAHDYIGGWGQLYEIL
jgi:hypothetical protein